jgi:hypothetical protein
MARRIDGHRFLPGFDDAKVSLILRFRHATEKTSKVAGRRVSACGFDRVRLTFLYTCERRKQSLCKTSNATRQGRRPLVHWSIVLIPGILAFVVEPVVIKEGGEVRLPLQGTRTPKHCEIGSQLTA